MVGDNFDGFPAGKQEGFDTFGQTVDLVVDSVGKFPV